MPRYSLHGRQQLRFCLLLALFIGEYNILPGSRTTTGIEATTIEAETPRQEELGRYKKLFIKEQREDKVAAAAVLGLKVSATETEVNNAYRALAGKHHPKRNPGSAAAEKYFQKIQEAYDGSLVGFYV